MTFWTPEIVQHLDQLSKLVGSFSIRCGLGWVLGGLMGTISSSAVPGKTTKNTRKMCFLVIKTTNCSPVHFYTFYSWQMFDIFMLYSWESKLKTLLFLFFKMLISCRDTRVHSYSTSARTMKSTNCSAWPHLYFLLMADGWNFCDIFLRP